MKKKVIVGIIATILIVGTVSAALLMKGANVPPGGTVYTIEEIW